MRRPRKLATEAPLGDPAPSSPYATIADLETKLKAKLGRPLTEDEKASGELLLEAASAAIDEATEIPEVAEPPPIFRFVALEVASRAMANPSGVSAQSETIGTYSYSEKYEAGDAAVWLTPLEERMVRRAALGRLSGSAEAASLASDVFTISELAPSAFDGRWAYWPPEVCEGS